MTSIISIITFEDVQSYDCKRSRRISQWRRATLMTSLRGRLLGSYFSYLKCRSSRYTLGCFIIFEDVQSHKCQRSRWKEKDVVQPLWPTLRGRLLGSYFILYKCRSLCFIIGCNSYVHVMFYIMFSSFMEVQGLVLPMYQSHMWPLDSHYINNVRTLLGGLLVVWFME